MFKKFLLGCAAGAAAVIGGKKLMAYAETNPDMKNVKDKIKKTASDLAADCADIGKAVGQAVQRKDGTEETEQASHGDS